MKNTQNGWTLIEILIVLAIIGFLALIILPNVNEARKKARDAVRIRDAQTLAKLIDSYYIEHNTLPIPDTPLKNVSSVDMVNWEAFWKGKVGAENTLYPPRSGQLLPGLSANAYLDASIRVPLLGPYRRFTYYYAPYVSDYSHPDYSAPANNPAIYVPLERYPQPDEVCDEEGNPEGCTPVCDTGIFGPFDSSNCGRGCIFSSGFRTSFGGESTFLCISVGPTAP